MEMDGLSVICAGLGLADEDERGIRIGYSKGEQCLENIKDLLRFLRRDDPQKREVFKQVCKWNIVSKDLVPIIEHCQDDRNLVLNAVKVLVFLTMPIEPSSYDIPQQIEYLWSLKTAITCSDTVAVIVSLLEGPLENLESEAFTEDDWKLVQLVMTLFRNILAIQDIPLQQKAGGCASQYLSLRERFLELLFKENVMDIIIVITQHVGGSCGYFRQDNLLLMETFHYIFMGQDPELIAKAHQKVSQMGGETKDSVDSLKSIIVEEEKRRLSRLRNVVRHSQFAGTFARLTMDGSKAVFKGNPASTSHNSIFKPHKGLKGVSKKIVWDQGSLPSAKDNVLELLHDFVNQFLSGSYNVLMQSIRQDIEKEHLAIQSSDIIIFFRVAQFVTSFQYHKILSSKLDLESETFEATTDEIADSTLFKGNICGPIASSMDESMFRLVISRWQNAFDGLKETNNYKFLSAAGCLMKNMIRMLDLVLKSLPENSKEAQMARILLYKLFYDQTEQGMTQFLLNLIKVFDTCKQPKSDLADLIEMIYVLLRLMENLQARGALRVSRKSRKGRKKGNVKGNKETELSENHATVQDENCISNSVRIANSCMSQKGSLVDATSDGQEDLDIPVKVDEPEMTEQEILNNEGNPSQKDNRKSDHPDDHLHCSTGDSSGDEQPIATNEVDFKVSTFLFSFANSSVIQKLCWLLKFYKSNSNRTNHYIICILRRIADDLELSPMLYQLSLLTIFYDILAEQKSCPSKTYANIVDFLTTLIQKMLKRIKNQPLLFVEILFWKTRRECHYINAEYLLHELGHIKKISGTWEKGSDIGGIGSLQAKGWACRSIADALGEDEADVVISHEFGCQKNGSNLGEVQEGMTSVSNSEIDGKGNNDDAITFMQEESGKFSKRKRSLVLGDEWEMKIKDLYVKFKDDRNCSLLIAESLDPVGKISAAQVANKLEQLGLQLASRKQAGYSGEPSTGDFDQHGEDQCVMETSSALHNSNDLEGSSLRHPLNTRKRVHAFNSDQEAKIKILFEQFKGHKRCSHMIANALDAGNKFTAAQISRKLKQLGLCAPRQKRSKVDMLLRDEELDDSSKDEVHDSDNETLLSLRTRRKGKDDSRLFGKSQEKNALGKFSDDSDDETLSSVLKKSRKLPVKPKDDRVEKISVEETNEDTGHGTTNNIMERDGGNQSHQMSVAGSGEGISINNASLEGTSKTEVIDTQPLGVSPVYNEEDLPHHLLDDDLADSGDDVTAGELMSSVNRRKLRMVIDPEED